MPRSIYIDPLHAIVFIVALLVCTLRAQAAEVVVADSATRVPLPNASVYDRLGAAVGMTDRRGVLPRIARNSYPLTVRYVGFADNTVSSPAIDTVFLREEVAELPEVMVESRRKRLLHILAYVREYSTMTTYSDTVFLFREKMVDYMLVPDRKVRFRGWSTPRVLASRSYYRFTNADGLDSVSDASRHHFSWTDWIGLPHTETFPPVLANAGSGADTVHGRYGDVEIWTRQGDRLSVAVNVLADTVARRWMPGLSGFFHDGLDFEKCRFRCDYDNVVGNSVSAMELTGYSFGIESNGRGHDMFRFNRPEEPFFVTTDAEVYVLDKEYITVSEARKWDRRKFDDGIIDIYEPLEAPALAPEVLDLVARVESIDRDGVRLGEVPDHRLVSKLDGSRNFRIGRRALLLLKQLTGITLYKSRKNFNRQWDEFRKERTR